MLYLVSGISSLCLLVNLILVPGSPFPTYLFLHPSLFPFPIHHCASITPSLFHSWRKTYLFLESYGPTPVVSLFLPELPPRTIAWTVYSELLVFYLYLFLIFSFLCCALWINLPISSAVERSLIYRIVSYRIVRGGIEIDGIWLVCVELSFRRNHYDRTAVSSLLVCQIAVAFTATISCVSSTNWLWDAV